MNLMADSESGSPSSYSHYTVTRGLPRLVLEIFVTDRHTYNADHYYSWPPHCRRPANKKLTIAKTNIKQQIPWLGIPTWHLTLVPRPQVSNKPDSGLPISIKKITSGYSPLSVNVASTPIHITKHLANAYKTQLYSQHKCT